MNMIYWQPLGSVLNKCEILANHRLKLYEQVPAAGPLQPLHEAVHLPGQSQGRRHLAGQGGGRGQEGRGSAEDDPGILQRPGQDKTRGHGRCGGIGPENVPRIDGHTELFIVIKLDGP